MTPQDEHLAQLMLRAQAALAALGLTVDGIIAMLPAVRAEVVEEAYGADFLRDLARKYGLHQEDQPDT